MKTLYLTILFVVLSFLLYFVIAACIHLVFVVPYIDVVQFPTYVIIGGLLCIIISGVVIGEEYDRIYDVR